MNIHRTALRGLAAAFLLLAAAAAAAQSCTLSAPDRARAQQVHLFGGQPTPGPLLVRRGYVAQYDAAHRVPRWVAWRASQEFRATIKRKGRWATFRPDPEVANPVQDRDYDDIFDHGAGFAGGHIAPYFISGGDRNGDGVRAPDDAFDACTVFEINYLSNITPQYHNRFNGSGGLWNELETVERQVILPRGTVLQIIAGTIFGASPDPIRAGSDIAVPDMFYRILVTDDGAVPFLFVHQHRLGPKGCALDARLETCIVTVADIERLTGADFFNALPNAREAALEGSDGLALWRSLTTDEPE